MKKLISLFIVAILASSLAACATKDPQRAKVKCPACGYEGLMDIYQP